MNIVPDPIDRHVDLALRREADAGPPADFARSVAALAQAPAPDPEIERWLMHALVAVFALAALVVAAVHGDAWVAAFGSLPMIDGATALNWAAAMLACVGLSWSLERLRPAPRRH